MNSEALVTATSEGLSGGPADDPMLLRAVEADGFVRINKAFAAALGWSASELAGRCLTDFIHPDDRPALSAVVGGTAERARCRHETVDGGWLELDVAISEAKPTPIVLARVVAPSETAPAPVRDADDREATVLGTLHEIAQIVEEQNPGYKCSILLVADGRFVRGAGPSLPEEYNAAIDGFAVGPAVGSCGTAIFWNVPVVAENLQTDPLWVPFRELAKKAGVAACWSHPFTSRSGSVLGALALYSPEPRAPTSEQLSRLRAAARMTGLAVERGRAEEALRDKRKRELELEEQLRQAAKMEALGVLAGGVAHDFNNVLATILGNAELALDLLGEGTDPDEVQDLLREVITASQRAGDFCKQMLAYAGRGALRDKVIELGGLLPQLTSLVQAAVSKKCSLQYALDPRAIHVRGDENQLLQVVMNLITNAAEAIGEEAGSITVATATVSLDQAALERLAPEMELAAGDYAKITVSDTGCGMDAETMARIFDPFYTTKFTGRGLGLAAVQGIIRKHGGVIDIDSEVGKGTTFTVLLPTTTDAADGKRGKLSVARPGNGKRVLLADDEAPLRAVLSRRLRREGFEVVEAQDGEEAVERFAEAPESFDCVMLDLSMPKRSGEEVFHELSARRADVPVILMSGYTEEEVVNRFAGSQLAGALQKPIGTVDLMACLRKALADDD